MSSADSASTDPFITFADLMAKVGYLLFHWSTLEQGLSEAIMEARTTLGRPATRVNGAFSDRLETWCALASALPENADNTAVVAQIQKQAQRLRTIRNTIVHGLMSGRSLPDGGAAYIVCTVGGYDNPTGETVDYSIDDLEHFAQAADACRRGFRHLNAFNYRLHPRFDHA